MLLGEDETSLNLPVHIIFIVPSLGNQGRPVRAFLSRRHGLNVGVSSATSAHSWQILAMTSALIFAFLAGAVQHVGAPISK